MCAGEDRGAAEGGSDGEADSDDEWRGIRARAARWAALGSTQNQAAGRGVAGAGARLNGQQQQQQQQQEEEEEEEEEERGGGVLAGREVHAERPAGVGVWVCACGWVCAHMHVRTCVFS